MKAFGEFLMAAGAMVIGLLVAVPFLLLFLCVVWAAIA
jgi:hypothetical protein